MTATYAITLRIIVDDIANTWPPYLTMSYALRLAAGLYRIDLPRSCRV